MPTPIFVMRVIMIATLQCILSKNRFLLFHFSNYNLRSSYDQNKFEKMIPLENFPINKYLLLRNLVLLSNITYGEKEKKNDLIGSNGILCLFQTEHYM